MMQLTVVFSQRSREGWDSGITFLDLTDREAEDFTKRTTATPETFYEIVWELAEEQMQKEVGLLWDVEIDDAWLQRRRD